MIGYVRCECSLFNIHSLKEKRSVVKSVITKIKQRLNVSIAEIDDNDNWHRATIGIAAVSNSQKKAEQELQKALKMLESHYQIEVMKMEFEWL